MRRVAISLHCYLRNSCGDIAVIAFGELYVGCAQVFFQPVQLRSSWNRNDPRFLRQQPGNGNLRRCALLLCRNLPEHTHESLVRFAVLFIKTGNDVTEIGTVKFRVLVDGAREEAFSQRTEGDEADSKLLKNRQNLALRFSPPEYTAPERFEKCCQAHTRHWY
jgi:hypothetical protein